QDATPIVRRSDTSTISNPNVNSVPQTQKPPEAPDGMVYIPGGKFTMGRNDGLPVEAPAHEESVDPYFMDKYEVTNEEYSRFAKETNRKSLPAGWVGGSYPKSEGRFPVVGVNWNDAAAY